jgi:hypothetical protein
LTPSVGDAAALVEVMDVLETIIDDELFCVVEDEKSLEVDEVESIEDELFVVDDVDGTTLDEVDVGGITLEVLDLVLEVEVGGTPLEVLDLVLEVEGATLLLLESRDASSYISSLLPAPQYS